MWTVRVGDPSFSRTIQNNISEPNAMDGRAVTVASILMNTLSPTSPPGVIFRLKTFRSPGDVTRKLRTSSTKATRPSLPSGAGVPGSPFGPDGPIGPMSPGTPCGPGGPTGPSTFHVNGLSPDLHCV